jgi:hypothetical protein
VNFITLALYFEPLCSNKMRVALDSKCRHLLLTLHPRRSAGAAVPIGADAVVQIEDTETLTAVGPNGHPIVRIKRVRQTDLPACPRVQGLGFSVCSRHTDRQACQRGLRVIL